MKRTDLMAHCLTKPGAYLDNPWGGEDTVVKVCGKIFCFLGGGDGVLSIAVKNTREAVQEWRARFPEHIGAGPYLHKELWNRVMLDGGGAPDADDAQELIDDSYELIVAALPKTKRP